MEVRIASPVGSARYEGVQACFVRTPEGRIGILPGHAEYVGRIEPGPIEIRRSEGAIVALVGAGTVHVRDDVVTLALEQWAVEAPDRDRLRVRLDALATALGEAEAEGRAAARLRRELAFVEACVAHFYGD